MRALLLLTACQRVTLPTTYSERDSQPDIYPDYRDVTIPVNIAPLTFEMNSQEAADNIIARFATDGQVLLCEGTKIQPDADDWHDLMEAAAGKALTVDVYTQKDEQWTHHKPFSITVSADSIDPWISYRLISPSYVTFEELTINQRCLENYDERVVYDNMLCGTEKDGQCINCHNYQQYNPERM